MVLNILLNALFDQIKDKETLDVKTIKETIDVMKKLTATFTQLKKLRI